LAPPAGDPQETMATDVHHPSEPPRPEDGALRFGRYADASDGTRDRLLDRPVTLRSAPAEAADNLLAEARFLARMPYPGLPCVHDFARDDAGAALVMPALNGLTLSAAVAARAAGQTVAAIADPVACTLTFLAICNALRAAHLRGVVHGDLGPDLIILTDDDQVVIEGWGKAMGLVDKPPSMRTDDLQRDIRSLGSCLFFALAGAPPPIVDGHLGALPPEHAVRIPGMLLATIRKAIASSAAGGFSSMAELRGELIGFLAGRAPQMPDAVDSAWGGWRRAAAILLLLVLAAGTVLAVNWRSLSSYATWGKPLVDDDFADAGPQAAWKSRWTTRGDWQHTGGRLVSDASYDCAALFRQRLSPPVAIEYTGFLPSNVRPGELSVWWCEGDPFSVRWGDDVDNTRSWFVQAGAYDNSWSSITQTPERLRQQFSAFRLTPDREHHFRVEIDVQRLAMWVDGVKIMEHLPLVPLGDGYIGLYTWNAGKSFDNVRIWQQPIPAKVSPLVIGDEALRAGRHADAIAAYSRVATAHRGQPLGAQAIYYQGLAQHLQGLHIQARHTWKDLPEGRLQQQAECLSIEHLLKGSDLNNAVVLFTRLWQSHPDLHGILRERWQVCGQKLTQENPLRMAAVDEWINLRDATFGDDLASGWMIANYYNRIGRWEEIVRRFAGQHREVAKAMLALGRNAEVLAADWSTSAEKITARFNLGDIVRLADDPEVNRNLRAALLCKLGRAAEAAKLTPFPAQIYLGGLDQLLATDALRGEANTALIAVGRLAEAAGDGVAGSPQSGRSGTAMLLLGRIDEAEQRKAETIAHRTLACLMSGRVEDARVLRAKLTPNRNRGSNVPWFLLMVGLPMIDEALGETGALRRALEHGATQTSGWGGRCAVVCAAALDPAKEEAVSNMPWRTEAEAWLQIARALRAELAGDRVAAQAAWRAYVSLPPTKRLLEASLPSIDAEAIARWRIDRPIR